MVRLRIALTLSINRRRQTSRSTAIAAHFCMPRLKLRLTQHLSVRRFVVSLFDLRLVASASHIPNRGASVRLHMLSQMLHTTRCSEARTAAISHQVRQQNEKRLCRQLARLCFTSSMRRW